MANISDGAIPAWLIPLGQFVEAPRLIGRKVIGFDMWAANQGYRVGFDYANENQEADLIGAVCFPISRTKRQRIMVEQALKQGKNNSIGSSFRLS